MKKTMKHRIKGAFEKLSGRMKRSVGAATKNRSLELEGAVEETKGTVRGGAAKTVAHARGIGEELKGRKQQELGRKANDDRTYARGVKNEAKGRARQKLSED